jgi:integrase
LERAGLVAPESHREAPTLDQWLSGYVNGRQDVKAATATVYGHTKRNLLGFFGSDRRLDAITAGHADAFRVYLKADEHLAENTVRRRIGISSQFFRAAVRRRIITSNPFDGQPVAVQKNTKRERFVTRAEIDAAIETCADPRWRLAFALARYGGLRCASEITRLTWNDVNWEKTRFTVHASKTEHHAGEGIRIVPIFPELAPYFQAAFDAAEPGDIHCCPQARNANQIYRKAMQAAIQKAGLKEWPKLFHNLRASRETELAESFPMHVVCEWIGNTVAVAAKHYLQTTEAHFAKAATEVQKAVQNPVQQVTAEGRSDSQVESGEPEKCPLSAGNPSKSAELVGVSMGDTGLEPEPHAQNQRENRPIS